MTVSRQPLVSVCVPTYNYTRFLNDCIESVQAQTLADWELIICDDCSTDNTSETIQEYARIDSRIKYVTNEQRLGMNGNIKRAAQYARGKYLKMLCSDDWLAPNCLEELIELMEHNPQAVLATSAEALSDEAGRPLRIQFLFGEPLSILKGEAMLDRMAKSEGFGGHSSFLIRSSAYETVGGYDDTLLYAADLDLAARLCRIGDYLHIDRPLFYGRVQPASSSTVNPGKLFDVIDWYVISDKVFRPRRFPNREWRRYQKLTAKLTARYLVNTVLEEFRGRHTYARNLRHLLLKHGNFLFGVPLLVVHIPIRIYRLLARKNNPVSIRPPRNVGTPSVLRRLRSEAEIQ